MNYFKILLVTVVSAFLFNTALLGQNQNTSTSQFNQKSLLNQYRIIQAQKYFDQYAFVKAAEKYMELYQAGDSTYQVTQRLAQCYQKYNRYVLAEFYYKKTIAFSGRIADDLFNYISVLKINGKLDDAAKLMREFNTLYPDDFRSNVYKKDEKLLPSEFGDIRYLIEPVTFNSENSDFGCVPYQNNLAFCSSMPTGKKQQNYIWDGKPFLDIYQQFKKNEKDSIAGFSKNINSMYHDGPVCFSNDFTEMFFTRNNFVKGELNRDKKGNMNLKLLYSSIKDSAWKDPISMPFNSDNYSNMHPSISSDGTTLYISSNRPGGLGGCDIYYCKRTNNIWETPVNAGKEVNTQGDDVFPFIYNNNVLYFSSTGHKGFGGLDIFIATKTDSTFSKIINIGEPVNSRFDDFCFVLNKEADIGYMASNREGGKGDDDIYMINLEKPSVVGCYHRCDRSPCVSFNVNGSLDLNGEKLTYEWLLGDGTSLLGEEISYCYKSAGKYHVSLNSISESGIKNENIAHADVNIESTEAGEAAMICANNGILGQELTFDGSGSYHSEGTITKYHWEFGDGSTDSVKICKHTFANAGDYKITLTIAASTKHDSACCDYKTMKSVKIFKDENEQIAYLKNIKLASSQFFNDSGHYAFMCIVKDIVTKEIIPGANVIVKNDTDTTKLTGITDANGKVQFTLKNDETYNINIASKKYSEKKIVHSTSNKTENEFSELIVELEKPEGFLLTGNVANKKDHQPIAEVNVELIDIKTGKAVFSAKSDEKGSFKTSIANRILNDSLRYKIKLEKEGYLGKTIYIPIKLNRYGQYDINNLLDVTLNKIEVGADLAKIIDIKPIYFDLSKWNIRPDAAKELDKIVKVMKDNPNMEIELGSHTDCRSSAASNLILSDKRAKSSTEYIVSKGISQKRITGKGYGETKLLNNCACEGNQKSDCSEAEHQLNRRTEFRIVKM